MISSVLNVIANVKNSICQFLSADLRELFSSSLVILFFKILGAVCGLGISILITQNLPIERAGEYFYLMSLLVIVATILRCGTEHALTRQIAHYFKQQQFFSIRFIYHYGIRLTWLFSLLFIVLMLTFSQYFMVLINISDQLSFMVIVFLPPLMALLAVQSQSFLGLSQTTIFAVLNILVRPLHLVLLLLFLIFYEFSIFLIMLLLLVATLMTLVIGRILWSRFISRNDHGVSTSDDSKEAVKNKFLNLLPAMWVASLFTIIMDQGGQFLVGVFAEPQESALFGVAVRIATIVSFVVMSFNNALAPKYAQLYSAGELDSLKSLYIKETLLRATMIMPMFVGIIIFSADILAIFGHDYVLAKPVLIWLIIGKMVNTLVGPTGMLLMMSDQHKVQRNILFIAASVLIAACCYLIPINGAVGAAQAACLAVIINNMLGLVKLMQFFSDKAQH
jgi:O-antigen/teichoic acid export membrane protein